jgi:putative endopeptidase
MKIIPLLLTSAVLLSGSAFAEENGLPPLTPDDLQFSPENMDTSVDPADDFYRYASGKWLDRVNRPADKARWDVFSIIGERLIKQLAAVSEKASESSAVAPKGSPTQLVGDFYKAYMNVEAMDAAGIEPIQSDLDAIEALETLDDLTRFAADQAAMSGPALFAIFAPSADPADSKRYAIFSVGPSFGVEDHHLELLRNKEGDPRIPAYRAYVAEIMKVAGYPEDDAARIADITLRIETALYAGILTPEEGNDPRNRYSKLGYEAVQAQVPEFDLDLYLETVGFEKPDAVYMFEPRALPELSKVLKETPLEDLKAYAAYRVIENYKEFLTSAFEEPAKEFNLVLTGARTDRPRQEHMYDLLKENLGHPASQLFVETYYSDETKAEVIKMVERIHGKFRERVETRDWLSEDTRAEALKKVDTFYYKVGYPDEWVDYSKLEIGADPVTNMRNLGAFSMNRMLEKIKKPVVHEEFNTQSTLPIVINAAYTPSINGFEVNAAITQPPAYSHDMDAPLRFCRIGAVIGHEMTHGFDSGGRRYDAEGNFRDWWTEADAKAFDREAQKLIDQANAFEVLPGLNANGPLNVRENMADVGGITLAYESLMDYLAEHPEENVEIDGLSPAKRCFIGWAQFWTAKASDPFLHMLVAGDGHPPSPYRAFAALQHVDAFYETFGIEEGDPMWLPPEKRVRAW